jgi:hypothetical protein
MRGGGADEGDTDWCANFPSSVSEYTATFSRMGEGFSGGLQIQLQRAIPNHHDRSDLHSAPIRRPLIRRRVRRHLLPMGEGFSLPAR